MALFTVTIQTDTVWMTESHTVNNRVFVDIYEEFDLEMVDDVGLLKVTSATDTIAVTDSVSAVTVSTLYASTVRAQGATKVRVDFANRVVATTPGTEPGTYTLSQPESYEITPVSPGAAPVVVLGVSLPVGQTFPNYVILEVTEMTDVAQYALSLVGNIVSVDNEPAGSSPTYYYGIGDSPTVLLVLAQDKNTVQVRFSEPLDSNDAVWNTDNYSFDNGLSVTEVSSVQGSIVTLKTTDQTPGALYNLTVLGLLQVTVNDRVTLSEEVLEAVHYIWLYEQVDTTDQVVLQGSFSLSFNDATDVADDDEIGLLVHVVAIDHVSITDAIDSVPIVLYTDPDDIAIVDSLSVNMTFGVVSNDTADVSDSFASIELNGTTAITGVFVGMGRNEAYSASFDAPQATGAETWSGTVPSGLSVNSGTGAVTGTCTEVSDSYVSSTLQCVASGITFKRTYSVGVGHYILLLHMDGANNGTVFTDQTGKVWTPAGNTKTVTDGAALGGSSAQYDGTGDYMSTPDHADFTLGTLDWTLECFVTLNGSVPGTQFPVILSQRAAYSTDHSFTFNFWHATVGAGYTHNGVGTTFNNGSHFGPSNTTAFTPGVRTHVAFSRKGSTIYVHVNGVPEANTINIGATSIINSGQPVKISTLDSSNLAVGNLNGNIDEMKFIVGAARYERADTFTPPSVASNYPA